MVVGESAEHARGLLAEGGIKVLEFRVRLTRRDVRPQIASGERRGKTVGGGERRRNYAIAVDFAAVGPHLGVISGGTGTSTPKLSFKAQEFLS